MGSIIIFAISIRLGIKSYNATFQWENPSSHIVAKLDIGRPQKVGRYGVVSTDIIKGVAGLWDVSLSKFILDMMVRSVYLAQIPDFKKRGFVGINQIGQAIIAKDRYGIPLAAREEIEKLFKSVEKGESKPIKLKEELDNWGVFEQYQDRFFGLFRK